MKINQKFINVPVEVDGSIYKIGIRDMVFIRTADGWVRSTKHPREVVGAINGLEIKPK